MDSEDSRLWDAVEKRLAESPGGIYSQKYNNLPGKFSAARRQNIRELIPIGKTIGEYFGQSEKYSDKHLSLTVDQFFDDIDRIAKEVLGSADFEKFIKLAEEIIGGRELTSNEWEILSILSEKVYGALLAANYNEADLWV